MTSLANLLVQQGIITPSIINEASAAALLHETTLTHYLVTEGWVKSEQIFDVCKQFFSIPTITFETFEPKETILPLISFEIVLRYRVIPLAINEQYLSVAIADPTDENAISIVSFHTGIKIKLILISDADINLIINEHYRSLMMYSTFGNHPPKPVTERINTPQIAAYREEEPVIHFVNQLIFSAIEKKASDIHIEPYETYCRIRYRCDGLLYETGTINTLLASQVINRLKIMALLDIAEQRLPQDGHFQLTHKQKIDIRISTCPTLYGEKIVLRILIKLKFDLSISTLGLLASQETALLDHLNQPQGLILVTGPTGSGKTMTLYAALSYLNKNKKNILTAEDPIEIQLPGINQVNINPKIGLSFTAIMRAFLRQDPDVIMLGEIRDPESAQLALQAAQTGHLVLTTLHTNNVIDSIIRLHTLDIPSYLIHHSLSLIIAQRLIRKICSYCGQAGCKRCHDGFNGRTAIFELLSITDHIRSFLENEKMNQLRNHLKETQWINLIKASQEKIEAGITTHAEVERILGKAIH